MKSSIDAPSTAPTSLHTSARLGLTDKLKASLEQSLDDLDKPDKLGRTPLHLCVLGGHEDCCELLLEKGAAVSSVDCDGQTPLHTAASSGLPMLSYLLASKSQGATLIKNKAGKSPVDLAAATQRGEVLNALLLACSGSCSPEALDSMKALLACGAVCDTWAPNGSSALMLAAAIDCTAGVELLLGNGATLELQDALGRTALMFAAGNDATAALAKLLDAGASVSIRDRRGRNVMDYAVDGSKARSALEEHLRQLESKASQLQAALLAELCGDEPPKQPPQQQQQPKAKKSKKKKSKAKKGVQAETAVASTPALSVVAEEEGLEEETPSTAAVAARSGDELPAESPAADRSGQDGDVPEASVGAGELASDVSSESQPGSCRSSMEHRRSPEAGSSAGEEGDGRSPSPPDSPSGWCTVSKAHSRQHSRPVAVPPCSQQQLGQQRQVSRLGLGQQVAAVGMAGRLEAGLLESSAGHVPRCPSSGSLASTCSGESHDTEVSRFSGSERSVLRPMRIGCLPGQHQSTGTKLSLHASSKLGQCPASVGSKGSRGLLPPTALWGSQPSLQQSAAGAAAPAGPAAWATVAEACSAELPSAAEPAAHSLQQVQQQQPPGNDVCRSSLGDGMEAEVAALREQVAALQAERSQAEVQHRQELAAVLEDAAQHEAKAVQQAVAAERMSCIVRFTGFLQQNGSTLCASFPEVFRHTQAPPTAAAAASAAGQDELFLLGDPLPALAPGALHIPLPQQPSSQHHKRHQLAAQQQHALGFACGGAAPRSFSSSDSSATVSPFGSVLASAANNYLGLAQSPPSTLAPLAFQPFAAGLGSGSSSSPFASTAPPCKLEGWPDAGSPLSTTPLPSAHFSYKDIEAQLRGEYKGNHSAFLVPAADSLSPLCSSLLSSLGL